MKGLARAQRSSMLTVWIMATVIVLTLAISVIQAPVAHAAQVYQGSDLSLLSVLPHALDGGSVVSGQQSKCPIFPNPPACFTPQQIRRVYDIQPLLDRGITGKGRTIVVAYAFQNPVLKQDLHVFDQTFGLNDQTLNITAPFGLTPFNPKDPLQQHAAGEISVDVEWSHAIAPDATIDLVLGHVDPNKKEGPSDLPFFQALLQATNYAIDYELGDVITQSFANGETCFPPALRQTEHQEFQKARDKGITVLGATNDTGALVQVCKGTSVTLGRGVEFPASDPLVTAVGGTTLEATADGTYVHETGWSQTVVTEGIGNGASGGGFSVLYSRPDYQDGVRGIGAFRGIPDIAYDGDVLTGVITIIGGRGVPVGGTSIGSPQWAGIVALADQATGKRLGFLNPILYRIAHRPLYLSAFHDITTGNNTFTLVIQGHKFTVKGYNAGPGWDPVTGVGTPQVAALVPLLIR